MQIYFAPMEGVTTYIYRNAYHAFFPGVDRYYTPFIMANKSGKLKTRELNDILPEHNKEIMVIPQILTNHAQDFNLTSERIRQYGYDEVNLNLGCPSKTVVAKKKGAGFLAYKEELDRFLDEIFSVTNMKISIKTRLGMERPEEIEELIKIYNKYPLEELIIHARVQKDYYNNKPDWDAFSKASKISKAKVCYNGDLFSLEHYKEFKIRYPKVDNIMIGRGFLMDPWLIKKIKNPVRFEKELLRQFHNRIYLGYQNIMSGDRNTLFKMKEIWFYMRNSFTHSDKYWKKIKKTQKLMEYEQVIEKLFENEKLQRQ